MILSMVLMKRGSFGATKNTSGAMRIDESIIVLFS